MEGKKVLRLINRERKDKIALGMVVTFQFHVEIFQLGKVMMRESLWSYGGSLKI